MSTYLATVHWQRGVAAFVDNRYPRIHEWRFDGGVVVPATSSPQVVPPPMSSETAVDPEEAFIASLASCHMLFVLGYASKAGYLVDDYSDHVEGVLARDADGRQAMTRVTLRPRLVFSSANGKVPTEAEHDALHHKAHEACFIASSVKSEIVIEHSMLIAPPTHTD